MKTLITIILTVLLAACGSGNIETMVKADEAITQPAVIVAEHVPATPVSPVPQCDLTTYIPCDNRPAPVQTPVTGTPPDGYELCDAWSYNPCAVPTWIPKR